MEEETQIDYLGGELAIFALAKHWRSYLKESIASYIKGAVAEVGAGHGATTQTLCDPAGKQTWLCIEPDKMMATELRQKCAEGHLPKRCDVFSGILANLPVEWQFDTILYIDVLEHIRDDWHELSVAAGHLTAGGRIIVESPAWPHLYSPFDRKIGHYRRYTKSSLAALHIVGVNVEAAYYLDSIGYVASFANKLLLRQDLPTRSQILFWDGWIVPVSRVLDPVIFWKCGRSVITIWQKSDDGLLQSDAA
jgi:SAM-dependent methyltransferase